MPHNTPEVRTAVRQAVFLSVREDRRLLGIPEKVRDQIVTWAFNKAMDYERTVTNPATMVTIEDNQDVVIDAMEDARDAGVIAFARISA